MSPDNQDYDAEDQDGDRKSLRKRIASVGDLLGKGRGKHDEGEREGDEEHKQTSSSGSHTSTTASRPGSSSGSPTSTSSSYTTTTTSISLTSLSSHDHSSESITTSKLGKRISFASLPTTVKSKGKEKEVPDVPALPEWARSSSATNTHIHSNRDRPANHRFSSLPSRNGASPLSSTPMNARPSSSHSKFPSATQARERVPSTSSANADWLLSNPYESIPRFSRLGLARTGVVMPVKKASAEGLRVRRASTLSMRSAAGGRTEEDGECNREGRGRERAGLPTLTVTPPEVESGAALARSASNTSRTSEVSGSTGSLGSAVSLGSAASGSVSSLGSTQSAPTTLGYGEGEGGKLVGWVRRKIGRAASASPAPAAAASEPPPLTPPAIPLAALVRERKDSEVRRVRGREEALAALEGARRTPPPVPAVSDLGRTRDSDKATLQGDAEARIANVRRTRSEKAFSVVRGARGEVEFAKTEIIVQVAQTEKGKGGLWRRFTSVRRKGKKERAMIAVAA